MSRKSNVRKRFPEKDLNYKSHLVNLLILKILKSGKKSLAINIVSEALDIIQKRLNKNPVLVLEEAILRASPVVELKSRRVGGSTYQVPIEIDEFRATILSLRWLVSASRQRFGKSIAQKLANEIIDTCKGTSNTIKRKRRTHKMAKANKAFAHYRR